MNQFAVLALGAAYGFLKTVVADKLTHTSSGDVLDSLCAQVGWQVNAREGIAARIYFQDPTGILRPLSIWSDEHGMSVFFVASRLLPPSLPAEVSQYLLARNPHVLVGGWMTEAIPQGVAIGVMHRAVLDGMTPQAFQYICSQLILEAQDFDAKLRTAGILR